MLREKFDSETLKDLDQKLTEIQLWSISVKADHHLYDIIDGLCRVAGMYNDVIRQYIEDGEIVTSDPQRYIQSKFGLAYDLHLEEIESRIK